MIRLITFFLLVTLIVLIFIDASFHFDQERIQVKRQHQSAQRHWNLFYKQNYTYIDSSFKYDQDIQKIRTIIEPNKLLLSDKATSYYLAAELPVYVTNVQPHHNNSWSWTRFLNKRYACYLENDDSLEMVQSFIQDKSRSDEGSKQYFKYWVVNKDKSNLNLRFDCLSARSSSIAEGVIKVSELIYEGEYLSLYQLD